MTKTIQLKALTGARGIAAWVVVFYHIRSSFTEYVPIEVARVAAKGYLAVDLFFVLSGFVMWLSYSDKFNDMGLRAVPSFIVRRFARIYPLHFFMMVVAIIMALAAEFLGNSNRQYPFAELPLHFFLVQNWGFTNSLQWNDPAWSISTEFACYLLLPFASLVLLRWRGTPLIWILLILAFSTILSYVFAESGAVGIGDNIPQLGLARCLAEFFCGVFTCLFWKSAKQAHQPQTVTIMISVVSITMLFGWYFGLVYEVFATPITLSALIFVLAITSNNACNPLSNPLAVFLGNISYSTYLVHYLLWAIVKLFFVSDLTNISALTVGIYVVLTFSASILLYHLIEVPARIFIQRRL